METSTLVVKRRSSTTPYSLPMGPNVPWQFPRHVQIFQSNLNEARSPPIHFFRRSTSQPPALRCSTPRSSYRNKLRHKRTLFQIESNRVKVSPTFFLGGGSAFQPQHCAAPPLAAFASNKLHYKRTLFQIIRSNRI